MIKNRANTSLNIPAKPWRKPFAPKKILIIRLQATGDVVITLPYLQYLRNILPPSTQLDFLTRKETEAIPKSLNLFNHVISIGGERNLKKQLLSTFFLSPKLFIKRYDVIIDLQHNIISNIVRKLLLPRAHAAFDRLAPFPAGEKYCLTIEAALLWKISAGTAFDLKDKNIGKSILLNNGWEKDYELIILNPAGAFETRNWSLENYISFSKLWLQRFPNTHLLLLGTNFIAEKAAFLKAKLGENLINLVNKTNPAEAFAVLQHAKLILSEDSGLMHMAWVSGIPTLALFGSTKSYWSTPLGEHTVCLNSSDLECGNCMLEKCKYGDTHCLTRYTPELVFQQALSLLERINNISIVA